MIILDSFAVEAYTASWIEICPRHSVRYWGNVEAYTASWIEILLPLLPYAERCVEAYTASWIEITGVVDAYAVCVVEAYTASWIEMFLRLQLKQDLQSRLIRPRGLKFASPESLRYVFSRGLYGLVD